MTDVAGKQADEIWGVQRGKAPAPVLSLTKGREPVLSPSKERVSGGWSKGFFSIPLEVHAEHRGMRNSTLFSPLPALYRPGT